MVHIFVGSKIIAFFDERYLPSPTIRHSECAIIMAAILVKTAVTHVLSTGGHFMQYPVGISSTSMQALLVQWHAVHPATLTTGIIVIIDHYS